MKCNHVLFLDDIELADRNAGAALHKAVQAGTIEILHRYEFPARGTEACMRMYTRKLDPVTRKMFSKRTMLNSVEDVLSHYDLKWECPNGDLGWAFAIARYKNLPGCPT